MTALLLQTTRWRDVTDDAALLVTAAALDPISVLAATTEPQRTGRVTGLSTIAASTGAVLRNLSRFSTLVVLGGRPLSSSAADGHLLSLGGLHALTAAVAAGGRRVAFVGVGAEHISGHRDAFYARRLMKRSSFTAVDGVQSVSHLAAAGAPWPMRTAPDLAWLALQDPPAQLSGCSEVWVPLTRLDVEAHGGASATADALTAIAAAVEQQKQSSTSVVVQGWRVGTYAGEDLEAAGQVVSALAQRGTRARVACPPDSLAAERDLLSRARLCVCSQVHTLMAAR